MAKKNAKKKAKAKKEQMSYETVADLEQAFPELVAQIRKEAQAESQKSNVPALDVPGFLLDDRDPFAEGALRVYMKLTGSSDLRLPYVLAYGNRKKAASVDKKALESKFDKTPALKEQFGSVEAYLRFSSLAVVQAIQSYIVRASGSGDLERTKTAVKALLQIRKK